MMRSITLQNNIISETSTAQHVLEEDSENMQAITILDKPYQDNSNVD
jgi:hypothetical protein